MLETRIQDTVSWFLVKSKMELIGISKVPLNILAAALADKSLEKVTVVIFSNDKQKAFGFHGETLAFFAFKRQVEFKCKER